MEPLFFERVVHHDQIADLRATRLVPRADPGEVAESRLFRKRKRCIRLGFIRVEHDVRDSVRACPDPLQKRHRHLRRLGAVLAEVDPQERVLGSVGLLSVPPRGAQ